MLLVFFDETDEVVGCVNNFEHDSIKIKINGEKKNYNKKEVADFSNLFFIMMVSLIL